MYFIGFITESKNEDYLNEIFRKYFKGKYTFIFIKENNIDNIKNVSFETIVLMREFKEQTALNKIIQKAKYFILNSDLDYSIEFTQNNIKRIITYGFNNKAMITASSVSNDEILFCIQENIYTINNNLIEVRRNKLKHKKSQKWL